MWKRRCVGAVWKLDAPGYGLLIIAMKSGAPFLGLAKYIYITLHVITIVFIHWNSPVFILLADTFTANLFHVRIYNLLIHCNSYLFDLQQLFRTFFLLLTDGVSPL